MKPTPKNSEEKKVLNISRLFASAAAALLKRISEARKTLAEKFEPLNNLINRYGGPMLKNYARITVETLSAATQPVAPAPKGLDAKVKTETPNQKTENGAQKIVTKRGYSAFVP